MFVLFETPSSATGLPETCNVIMSDNEALRDYIKTGFIEKLGTFGGAPTYSSASQLTIDNVVTQGDPTGDFYSETITGGGQEPANIQCTASLLMQKRRMSRLTDAALKVKLSRVSKLA
jgi:hypothetical protein